MDPRRKRIPPIVARLQSRRGSTRVAPSVRQENNSIKASYNDSPEGASRSSSAHATTETSAARKPITRVCRSIYRHQKSSEPGNGDRDTTQNPCEEPPSITPLSGGTLHGNRHLARPAHRLESIRCDPAWQKVLKPASADESPNDRESCRDDRGRTPIDRAIIERVPGTYPRDACQLARPRPRWRSASGDSRAAWTAHAETASCEPWRVPGCGPRQAKVQPIPISTNTTPTCVSEA